MRRSKRDQLQWDARAADALGNPAEAQELEAEWRAAEEQFANRVSELENEGLTTSDAQGVAEAEGW